MSTAEIAAHCRDMLRRAYPRSLSNAEIRAGTGYASKRISNAMRWDIHKGRIERVNGGDEMRYLWVDPTKEAIRQAIKLLESHGYTVNANNQVRHDAAG